MNTGGPAFPNAFPDTPDDEYYVANGMTLRDYFAAKAIISMPGIFDCNQKNTQNICAKIAYQIADAMLKARAQ